LLRIEEIFSAAKTKTLIRTTTSERKHVPCYQLIREKADQLYQKQSKNNVQHPLHTHYIASTNCDQWLWFKQATSIFTNIYKQTTKKPEIGDFIWEFNDDNLIFIHDQHTLEQHEQKPNSIPVRLRRRFKVKNYLKDRFRVIEIIENCNDFCTIVDKAPAYKSTQKSDMFYPHFE